VSGGGAASRRSAVGMYSSLTHGGGGRYPVTLIVATMDPEKWLEQHDRMMADHDRWLAKLQERDDRHDREMLAIGEMLRHAVRLSVREAPNERAKRRELDEKITRIAASLQAFLDSMRRGGNGQA